MHWPDIDENISAEGMLYGIPAPETSKRKVRAPVDLEVVECNCSMCSRTGFQHLIVDRGEFKLLCGEDALTTYTFNTGVGKHLFCRVCGVKSFYVPRSNPDGYSLNLNCMDRSRFRSIEVREFDGRNWEKNAAALAHLSKE